MCGGARSTAGDPPPRKRAGSAPRRSIPVARSWDPRSSLDLPVSRTQERALGAGLEFYARAAQARDGRALGDTEECRDLAFGELLELEQHEHRAKLERERVEHLVEQLAPAADLEQLLG